MIVLEGISPSGDKVKVDIEGEVVSLTMVAPASAGTGEVRVYDTGMAEFVKNLELQLAAGTYQPCDEFRQRPEIGK